MSPEELEEFLKRQPFQPFVIHMSNGRTYHVRHPEAATLTMDAVHVGVYAADDRYPKALRALTLVNINELEPLTTAN